MLVWTPSLCSTPDPFRPQSRLCLPHTLPGLQLHSESMTAIASRNVAHPVLPVLAAATNSGRIHVYR